MRRERGYAKIVPATRHIFTYQKEYKMDNIRAKIQDFRSLVYSLAGQIPQNVYLSTLDTLTRLETAYAAAQSNESLAGIHILTPRERDILSQLSLGLTRKDLAQLFCISEGTVKVHLSNIYAKLGVSNQIQAVNVWRQYMELSAVSSVQSSTSHVRVQV